MATSRPRRGSRARYTSPMPPAPRGPFTSYAPSLVPLGSAMPYTPVLVIVFASTAAGQLFGWRGVYEKGAVRRNAPLLAHVRPGGRQFPNCRQLFPNRVNGRLARNLVMHTHRLRLFVHELLKC